MHFATRVRTGRVARLYSETALSRKPFWIGHMYIYTFLLRVTDTMTSKNIYLCSWDILYMFGVVGPDFSNSGPYKLCFLFPFLRAFWFMFSIKLRPHTRQIFNILTCTNIVTIFHEDCSCQSGKKHIQI
jgi:hypothetical protein